MKNKTFAARSKKYAEGSFLKNHLG